MWSVKPKIFPIWSFTEVCRFLFESNLVVHGRRLSLENHTSERRVEG